MNTEQTLRPLITPWDVCVVEKQTASMWIGRGRRVLELERRMAAWVGAEHAVAFGSGTAALTVAFSMMREFSVWLPPDVCPAVWAAARASGIHVSKFAFRRLTVYPNRGGYIEDFARHLPREGNVKLIRRFGVFSFGALKDVTGGIGGCLAANEPIDAGDWRALSPLSDINAALILSQLDRYTGHTRLREVADGKTWESPA